MIITIARQCGCQGDLVGAKLAEHFELPLYDKKHIRELAEKCSMAGRYPGFFEERETNLFLEAIAADMPQDMAQKTAIKALTTTLGNGPAVVIGRCGNFVYEEEPDVVRIFLCGPMDYRIEQMEKAHDISRRRAKRLVEETDARRASYHKYYTGQTWGFGGNYDLCIDESRVGADGVVNLVCAYIAQSSH
ncbi:cytidylate kinase-like family protein [Hespellia stercorisuis]|uniref:Cytidylate kinase n=1 Tax=Hespellia stercorisuis DSM 15480 TaxID=1121950 RepID=A0A1M6QVW1_9FIRM|nr:cytidylate kinase-like family protein [Hespellia stercorisuis]SHK24402.1 Cytidylate kinase [Hespellia stercorisuis DSM 15480]